MAEAGGMGAWRVVGSQEYASWYLDPLVALQKREEHVRLIERMREWVARPRRVLKTDLFEEAFGEDQLLGTFPVEASLLCGVDIAPEIVAKCQTRFARLRGGLPAADIRALPFRDASFDWIVSNSSLDHFDSRAELERALAELARVLAPGGVLLLTLDNPRNPLYYALRLAARCGWAAFPLGATLSAPETWAVLERCGLRSLERRYFLFNPRGVSTLLFLLVRKLLAARGDGIVRAFLWGFAKLDAVPARPWTACFHATWAQKHDQRWKEREGMAPRVGFEPTTFRLTAERSTVELPGSVRTTL
jgi:SAM-dependent methyltransferase